MITARDLIAILNARLAFNMVFSTSQLFTFNSSSDLYPQFFFSSYSPMATAFIRGKVSKKKKRFQEDGYDLDLTYITPNIVAMGFPSEGMEASYRNSMHDVQRFFTKRHPSHYKIYNVCSERRYEASKFESLEPPGISCQEFVWDDHNPPKLALILPFVEDMVAYLQVSFTLVYAFVSFFLYFFL